MSGLPRRYSIGGAVVLVVVLVLGIHVVSQGAPATDAPVQTPHVHIVSIADLSATAGPLPVTGKVTSLSQATILAQSAGEVTSLLHALGDRVSAGGEIAELENSSQRAALLQAQGAFDAAQVQLAKTSGTSATISGINSAQATQSLANAQNSAETSLQSAYAALDDAVHTKSDALFSGSRTTTPKLIITIPDSQLVMTLQNERVDLELLLGKAQVLANPSSNDAVAANVVALTAQAQTVQTFLNNLVSAVNKAIPTNETPAGAIAGYQASISAARTEVVGAIAGLVAAKSALDQAGSGAASASNSATSAATNDIAASRASLKQAQGALNAAEANLEKTILRSPISGTIVSLPISRGDYVSMNAQAAVVSNPSALEIDAYVTPDDAKTIVVGGKATIDQKVAGVVVSVAPALDPTTNKILVKIGITGNEQVLTDGDTVSVAINRTVATQSTADASTIIPITAVKITPEGPVVFTVAGETLVAHKITLGSILGDQVMVPQGITPDMAIVTDARGLSDGQTIVIDTN